MERCDTMKRNDTLFYNGNLKYNIKLKNVLKALLLSSFVKINVLQRYCIDLPEYSVFNYIAKLNKGLDKFICFLMRKCWDYFYISIKIG